jgi:hypothetical protein
MQILFNVVETAAWHEQQRNNKQKRERENVYSVFTMLLMACRHAHFTYTILYVIV